VASPGSGGSLSLGIGLVDEWQTLGDHGIQGGDDAGKGGANLWLRSHARVRQILQAGTVK
jgi:hypothetical protein